MRRSRNNHGQFRSLRSAVMDSVTAGPTSVQVPVEAGYEFDRIGAEPAKNSKPAAAAALQHAQCNQQPLDVLDGGAGRIYQFRVAILMLQLVK